MSDLPKAYWRLGETSGSTAADERGAAPGSYQGGVTLGLAGALAGDTNRSNGYDGSNDRISMGDPSSGVLDVGTLDFTFEAWVKAVGNEERVIASKRSKTASAPYWRVTVTDDAGHVGEVRAAGFDGVASVSAYGPAIRVDNGVWHHVVAVFDRDVGITIWVDGLSRATAGALPRTMSNSGSFYLARSPEESLPYFRGQLDEVAVYGAALSADRVAAHRSAGNGGFTRPGEQPSSGWVPWSTGRTRPRR